MFFNQVMDKQNNTYYQNTSEEDSTQKDAYELINNNYYHYTLTNPVIENKSNAEIPRIRVIVRKRPLNKKEINRNDLDIIDLRSGSNLVVKELK